MQVKGTALRTTRDFVKVNFPGSYDKWISMLSPDTQKIYTSIIDATAWYPFKEGYILPMNKIMELCFDNNHRVGGEQLGSWSAEVGLKGFYKVFLLVASPHFLMQRASKIFTTYYDPSEIDATIEDSNHAILRVLKCEDVTEVFEYRIAGWVRKALELANCKGPRYEILKAKSKGDLTTEIHFHWQ
jgi:hypothetical protein